MKRFTLTLGLIVPILSMLSALAAIAQIAPGVKWTDLPGHLESKQVPVENWPVVDCPAERSAVRPDRCVAQWIENTFYLWEEHDADGRAETPAFYIVMLKPEARRLDTAGARTLLTASTLWRKLQPSRQSAEEELEETDPALRAIPEPLPFVTDAELDRPPRTGPVDESDVSRAASPARNGKRPLVEQPSVSRDVINGDDRVRITNTVGFPWYLMSYLESEIGGNYYRGSGCAVTPYMILTCAHNVYNQQSQAFKNSMTIMPGQKQYSAGGTVHRPWGKRAAAWFRCNSGYTSGGSWAYDYAAVHFEAPFWSVATYLPLEFDSRLSAGDILNMSGYPSQAHDNATFAQWFSSGDITIATNRTIRGYFDVTGGNSGSAMYYYLPSEQIRRICGIVAFGGEKSNGGPQLVRENMDLIVGWMEWTPDRTTPPDRDGGETPLVKARFGETFEYTTDDDDTELLIGPDSDPRSALLRLQYRAPSFSVFFNGNWFPIGMPNAASAAYGKGFKLHDAHASRTTAQWTFQSSLTTGSYGLYQKDGETWTLKQRIECLPGQ